MIGKLERVALREVWRDEARDFTPWLQENIDVLNEALNLNLSNPEREQSAGSFSVDILAEDDSGDTAVIENQLERSDHDHLGKLITYLTSFGAKTGIWIVSDPRPEHVSAITWLNESSAADFYLVKVEAVRIGCSDPAPMLTQIVGPSEEGKALGETKRELAERHQIRYRFWSTLLERAKSQTSLHSSISPSHNNWVSASAGIPGLGFGYLIRQHNGNVELYIDLGKDKDDENLRIFDKLELSKSSIEAEFDSPIEWQRLEGKRGCRIKSYITIGGYKDEDSWPEIQKSMIDAMIRLEKVLKPHIENLKV